MIEQLKTIWQSRELLWYIVKLQMKAENKFVEPTRGSPAGMMPGC